MRSVRLYSFDGIYNTDVPRFSKQTSHHHNWKWVRFAISLLLGASIAFGQANLFPLKDIRPGQRGIGKTVFRGTQVDEFQVEILGVLENIAPQQSIILAKLSGGPLEQTGVLQGMSGSPVYIDGKLVGAVALGFPFSKEAIAGIQPIEQMMGNIRNREERPNVLNGQLTPGKIETYAREDKLQVATASSAGLRNIATPISFSGFTERTLQTFAPDLRKLGFEPQQGVGSGGLSSTKMGKPSAIQPGSMITVQLMDGDLNIGADGTVTHIDGEKIYAFGHRFLSTGSTELPFARAEVLALLPSTNTSFKISTSREMLGSITSDRSTAVSGEFGRQPNMVPLTISFREKGKPGRQYHMGLVRDRLLTPFLTQMAIFSAVDATERTLGAATLRVSGKVIFDGASSPLVIQNIFASDTSVAMQAALNSALPLSYALQGGIDESQIKGIEFSLEPDEQKRQLQLDQLWASKREAHPGETIELTALFSGENGAEITRSTKFTVPVGFPLGQLNFTASDANALNLSELAGFVGSTGRRPQQLLGSLNQLRSNDRLYIRVWRQDPSFTTQGGELNDPPPSVALILSKSGSTLGAQNLFNRGAQITELSLSPGDSMVTGSKTVQVEIKE